MGRINPWLQERLTGPSGPQQPSIGPGIRLSFIVQILDNLPETIAAIRLLDTRIEGPVLSNFIRAVGPASLVTALAATGNVVVSYDGPVWIRLFVGTPPSITDTVIGHVDLSAITVPMSPSQAILGLPVRLLRAVLAGGNPIKAKDPDIIIVPTSVTRKTMETPEDNKARTKVAVLDTGIWVPHLSFNPEKGRIQMGTFAGPSPLDMLGHGMWCITALGGDTVPTRFGDIRGVADPINGTLGSWKVLSDIGFGSTWSIIQGMDAALKWGARVISMSLGGVQQGPVSDDPLVQATKVLYEHDVVTVVAAGNDGAEWTIGSPGVSPWVVTVGAWSTVYNGPAIFSSRGPSGKFYKDHTALWERDLQVFGDNLLKPDIMAPGGGPVTKGQQQDQIYSGGSGWTDPIGDMAFDLLSSMRGTSMATPAAAGLILLAVDHAMLHPPRPTDQVKTLMKTAGTTTKSPVTGYGFLTWTKLGGRAPHP